MSELIRIYNPQECAVFCKTKERFGGNSNMAAGYPLLINGINIRTSEALYQACRFPSWFDIQKKIISERSPISAKMAGKPFRKEFTRGDFEKVRVSIMQWCLRVKLFQNWEKFSETLLETGDLPVVELSTKSDDFWGAVVVKSEESLNGKRKRIQRLSRYVASDTMPEGYLAGCNVMGCLIQELRENIKSGTDQMSADFTKLPPLPIENFLLYGNPIKEIFRK